MIILQQIICKITIIAVIDEDLSDIIAMAITVENSCNANLDCSNKGFLPLPPHY